MTDTRLPPFVIVNAAGQYRTANGGWSKHRQEAISFDDAVSATQWLQPTTAAKRLDATVQQVPFDIDATRAAAGLPPVPLDAQHRSEFDPHEAA
jgi:hypothetical protein